MQEGCVTLPRGIMLSDSLMQREQIAAVCPLPEAESGDSKKSLKCMLSGTSSSCGGKNIYSARSVKFYYLRDTDKRSRQRIGLMEQLFLGLCRMPRSSSCRSSARAFGRG